MQSLTKRSGKSSSELAPLGGRARLGLVAMALVALWLDTATTYAGPFDIPPSDFNIMDADGTRLIGRGHYEVTPDGKGYESAFGEDRFNDGEYDIERDRLELQGDDRVPLMLTFEHASFDAHGTPLRIDKANLQTGAASCVEYNNGQPVSRDMVLQFPPDTFAGSAIVIPLKAHLSLGKKSEVALHAFNCIPRPTILRVKVYPQPASQWAHFSGEVVRVDIKPDFGWLNLLIAPFVPEIRAWFIPTDDWRFVGGQFTRFYKGPQILLVLVPKPGHKEARPKSEAFSIFAGGR